MEVCGTHTMALFRYGLTPLLAEAGIEMISGPGCPVCITPNGIHEAAIKLLTEREGLTLAAFGDMTRVPTRLGSLQTAVPARNSRLRIVYSPEEALDEARSEPGRDVVFFGAGFETTIPAIALTIRKASVARLANFSVLPAMWLIPPALEAMLHAGNSKISGFIYPGHVSAVIGLEPYEFVAKTYGIPGAVAGFEPGDILLAIRSIVGQAAEGTPRVSLEYGRVVRPEGNPVARAVMAEVLAPCDGIWRGLGQIPASAMTPRPEYAWLDTRVKYNMTIDVSALDLPGCRCGEVLRAAVRPDQCPLFGKRCTPESPLGPCMVSYEGACLIVHKYGRGLRKPA